MSLRALGRACVALFALSTAFPVVAAALNADPPLRWLGVADVAVAAMLVGVAVVLSARARRAVTARHRLAAFRASRGVAAAIPVLLAAYFVLGARVNWPVLVIGLAWRAWLLVHTLPALAAARSVDRPAAAA